MYQLTVILPDGRVWVQEGVAYPTLGQLQAVVERSADAIRTRFGKGVRFEYTEVSWLQKGAN